MNNPEGWAPNKKDYLRLERAVVELMMKARSMENVVGWLSILVAMLSVAQVFEWIWGK